MRLTATQVHAATAPIWRAVVVTNATDEEVSREHYDDRDEAAGAVNASIRDARRSGYVTECCGEVEVDPHARCWC